jgi:hypothetical protein
MGTELISEDYIIVIFNNAILLQGLGEFGWSVDLVTAMITHASAFDPGGLPPDSYVTYEYWVRTI